MCQNAWVGGFLFVRRRLAAALSTTFLLGAIGATVIALAGCAPTVAAGGRHTATADPTAALGGTAPPVSLAPTSLLTPTPAATPTPGPVATPPPVTEAPTSVAYSPPTVSISVSPAVMYEEYASATNPDCINFDTTYADVTATITTSDGVASATEYFSFGGNSAPTGNSGSGALSLVSGDTWSTEQGGYVSTRFTVEGTETVTYYVVVVDNHGTSVTSSKVTNTLTECDQSYPYGYERIQ